MNTQAIAMHIRKNGGKVLRSDGDSVLAENAKGIRHSFWGHDKSLTEDVIKSKMIVKKQKKKAEVLVKETQTKEEFAAELVALKGVGALTAEKVSENYTKDQLIASLMNEEDLGLSAGIMSALKKAYL